MVVRAGLLGGRGKAAFGLVRDSVTCAALGACGDAIAQTAARRRAATSRSSSRDHADVPWDFARTARMAGFGLSLYGPMQHYWYRALKHRFGSPSVADFAAKVTLNQIVLGPVVLSMIFSWNLGWQGRFEEIPQKIKQDLVPTQLTGWKFWVPASVVNFTVVPLHYQVVYMSCCGVVWNYIMSTAAN